MILLLVIKWIDLLNLWVIYNSSKSPFIIAPVKQEKSKTNLASSLFGSSVTITNDNGDNATIQSATNAGVMSPTDKSKLHGVQDLFLIL